jgi:hypothetical protein
LNPPPLACQLSEILKADYKFPQLHHPLPRIINLSYPSVSALLSRPVLRASADDLGMSSCQVESIRCSMIHDNCCLANRLQWSETFDDVQFLLRCAV